MNTINIIIIVVSLAIISFNIYFLFTNLINWYKAEEWFYEKTKIGRTIKEYKNFKELKKVQKWLDENGKKYYNDYEKAHR